MNFNSLIIKTNNKNQKPNEWRSSSKFHSSSRIIRALDIATVPFIIDIADPRKNRKIYNQSNAVDEGSKHYDYQSK